MEIKSFVKRINTQIRRGKRPVKRKINFEYQGKVYIFTSFKIDKSTLNEESWNNMSPLYSGETQSGHIIRIEKNETDSCIYYIILSPQPPKVNDNKPKDTPEVGQTV